VEEKGVVIRDALNINNYSKYKKKIKDLK